MELKKEFNAEELPLGWYFNWLSKLYFGVLTKKLEHLDIDRYFLVLLLLDKLGKPVCQQTLCDILNIDKTYMVKIVDYLHQHAYILKHVSPDDRRRQLITLSGKADAVIPDIEEAFSEIDRNITESMGNMDLPHFKGQFQILGKGLLISPHFPVEIKYKKSKK